MATVRFLIALALIVGCDAYLHYQFEIPNGDNVPHPCKPNFIWRGVGHKNALGGGPRNPFGLDFAKYNRAWTYELCMMDSDNDGLTNGEELGDPECTWTKGNLPQKTTGITHPGVCDPWGSDKCKEANKLITCNTGEFNCPDINSPDVFNVTLRFPKTRVPAKETTYICYHFKLDLPDPDQEYHLIASEPYIDNPNVMHHTVLMGCGSGSELQNETFECMMGSQGCGQTISVWTLGLPGECVYKEAGFRIGGRNGYTHLMMQHHWTNPKNVDNYVDSSGMILHLTKKFRKFDAGYFSTGQMNLHIPPGETRVVAESTCTSECTKQLIDERAYLFSGWNHMHYLGYSQNVELFRNGVKLRDLTPDELYSYDNPIVHVYNPPVELLPGDELKTTCVYRSISRTRTATYGEGSYDEMCFGIFSYYPKQNIKNPLCVTYDDLDLCNLPKYNCDLQMLFNKTSPERNAIFQKVLNHCDFFGVCRRECPAVIMETLRHPCFAGKFGEYMLVLQASFMENDPFTLKFLSALTSCGNGDDYPPMIYPTAAAGDVVFSCTMLVMAFLASLL